MADPAYRRVLLKLSGEALMGERSFGIDPAVADQIADEVVEVRQRGVELAIVIGGGNIFRGLAGSAKGMDRTTADNMGMLATVVNGLALSDALEGEGVQTRVMSAIDVDKVCEPFIRRRAIRHLEKGRVVILVGGLGIPYFTTDSTAAQRAVELECDVLLKATMVDGVYDKEPKSNPEAKRYDRLSYHQVLSRDLKVIDAAAISLARENAIPILVFSIHNVGAFVDVLRGVGRCTVIDEGE